MVSFFSLRFYVLADMTEITNVKTMEYTQIHVTWINTGLTNMKQITGTLGSDF